MHLPSTSDYFIYTFYLCPHYVYVYHYFSVDHMYSRNGPLRGPAWYRLETLLLDFIIKRFLRMRQIVVVGIWVFHFFVASIFMGAARLFREHTRPSLQMFLVVQILTSCTNTISLWICCTMSKSTLLVATAWRTHSQMQVAQSYLSTRVRGDKPMTRDHIVVHLCSSG